MKDVILNCSMDATAVPALARKRPLVLAPFLGASVLEHALVALAAEGVKRVQLDAAEHTEPIRRALPQGQAWGIDIQFTADAAPTANIPGTRVISLDTLPQLPQHPLWTSYRDWYEAQLHLLPSLAAFRVGMKNVAAGVFVGLRPQIAPDATIKGPCWIGANVFIGPGAVIGSGTVIEDGCYLDSGAEVAGSIVGPQTYVGKFTEVRDSFAWGSGLLHLDSGSLTEVADPFLLGALRQPGTLLGRWAKIICRIFCGASTVDHDPHSNPRSQRRPTLRPVPAN